MARGGVNRAVVKIARDALLARGIRPSIDAVRIELGNTGSKSTILRCLRELDEQEALRQSPSLDEELATLIGPVADRIREEAQAAVAAERELLTRQQMQYRTQRQQDLERTHELQRSNADLAVQLKERHQVELELQGQLRTSENERTRLQTIEQSLRQLAEEHDQQLKSLEEKNLHARQSLEHYRQTQKEQRDQELKRHDENIQQLRHEIRTLQERLISKQDELTTLNRDNERLANEAKNLIAQLHNWEMELYAQRKQHNEESTELKAEQISLQNTLVSVKMENVTLRERLRQRLLEIRNYQRQFQKKRNSFESGVN